MCIRLILTRAALGNHILFVLIGREFNADIENTLQTFCVQNFIGMPGGVDVPVLHEHHLVSKGDRGVDVMDNRHNRHSLILAEAPDDQLIEHLKAFPQLEPFLHA